MIGHRLLAGDHSVLGSYSPNMPLPALARRALHALNIHCQRHARCDPNPALTPAFLGVTRDVLGEEREHTGKSESLNVYRYSPLYL